MTQQQQHRIALGLFSAFSLVFAVNVFLLQPLERSVAFRRSADPAFGSALETATNPSLTPAHSAADAPSKPADQTVVAAHDAAAPLAEAAVTPVAVPAADPGLLAAVLLELTERGKVVGAADNPMDIVTRAAIMEAEWDHRLPLSGVASEALLQRLIMGGTAGAASEAPSKLEPGPLARDVIRTVQQSLQMLGMSGVKPDGVMGAATAKAIRSFESKHGLTPTGRISGLLMKRLGALGTAGKLSDRG